MDEEYETAREALRNIRLFSDVLGSGELDQLAQQCRPAFFLGGATLMSQGDFGSSMFCITDGTVSVTFIDPLDRLNEVTQLSAGSVVGEMALLTGDRRTATVRAVSAVHALEVTKPSLERMFTKSPDLIESFGAVLARRQARLDEIASDATGSVRARFARQIRAVFVGILSGPESGRLGEG